MHIEAEQTHPQSTELDAYIGMLREAANRRAPFREDLLTPARIRADADRAADVIEHDRGLRHGARNLDELTKLRVIHPRIESEPERGQAAQTVAKGGTREHVRWRNDRRSARFGQCVPCRDIAYAAKSAAAHRDLGFEHVAHSGAQTEICIADDAGRHTRRAELSARAHRGDAVDELDFTDRLHCLGRVLSIHRLALHEYG